MAQFPKLQHDLRFLITLISPELHNGRLDYANSVYRAIKFFKEYSEHIGAMFERESNNQGYESR